MACLLLLAVRNAKTPQEIDFAIEAVREQENLNPERLGFKKREWSAKPNADEQDFSI
jgi:hypothetical protein